MMKKLLIASMALVMMPSVLAVQKTTNTKTIDPWKVSLGVHSDDGISTKDFDYFLKVKYQEGQKFYSVFRTMRTAERRFRFRFTQGIGVFIGPVKPFFELYYDWSKAKKVKSQKNMGYTGGVAFQFNEFVSLSGSVHNFVTKHPSITLKGVFNLSKHVSFITTVSDSLPMRNQAYTLALGYSFG